MKVIVTNTVALNGGDFAILHALINVLKATYGDDIEVIVYDSNPEIARELYPNMNFRQLVYYKITKTGPAHIRKINLKRLLAAAHLQANGFSFFANLMLDKNLKTDLAIYSTADLIVSTGGTYLVENYNLNARIYEFNFCLALKKPLVLFTQSLGPFRKKQNKANFQRILNQAALILLRDEASFNNLKALNIHTARMHVCADVVFAEAEPEVLNAARYKKLKTPLSVGISVREWRHFKGRSVEEGMEQYRNAVAAICEFMTTNLQGTVTFISTCQGIKGYRFDDANTAQEIYSSLSEEAKFRTTVNKNFYTPEALKEIIQSFDVVVSTRMHFAIQALSMGVPVLPVAYEFKTKELFGKWLDPRFILDIDTIETAPAVASFEHFLNVLPALRETLFDKVQAERNAALMVATYLQELIPGIAHKRALVS